MSLAARFAEAEPKESGLPCGIARVTMRMSEADRKALVDVLFDEKRLISNSQLQRILLEEGYDISYSSVAQHRRRQCRCFVGRNIISDKESHA